jgi:predicted membrane protein
METPSEYNRGPQIEKPKSNKPKFDGRVFGGLIIVIVGSFLLLKQLHVPIPHWVFTPWTFLIALGLFIGVRHQFKGFGWAIPILIGSSFLVGEIFDDFSFHRFFWPVLIISIGLYMILRPKKNDRYWGTTTSSEDFIDATAIFGGVKRNIITKKFKGGDVTSVFGGSEINLSQADIEGKAVLDVTALFGGSKIIVPSNWQINSEDVTAIFGSLDDKRAIIANQTPDPNKILVITGTVMFGGIDLRSF